MSASPPGTLRFARVEPCCWIEKGQVNRRFYTPVIDIEFSPGLSARAVIAPPDVDGARLITQLGLPPASAVVAVNGSTAEGTSTPALTEAIVEGVGGAIINQGWTAVTGATDAGVFSLLGQAAEALAPRTPRAPWIGVAPLGLVTWPGHPSSTDAVPLERHHSHFALVEGDKWGNETRALLALTSALGERGAPSAAVIAGGGAMTRREAAGHARAGRPIIVLGGSGRLADELARAVTNDTQDDDELAGILRYGRVVVCDIADGPSSIAAALIVLLEG